MRRYLAREGIPVTRHNQVRLLMSGHDKFADLFSAIRRARHHIHLEYFNFRNDSIASTLFRLLAQKAKEGVEVRALSTPSATAPTTARCAAATWTASAHRASKS